MAKATQQNTKTHNRHLVLQTIYSNGSISRADIARLTSLTPTTVSSLVAELMEDGLIADVGAKPSGRGKPPILLSVVADARYLVGIDLAGSVLRGSVVDLRGNVVHRSVVNRGDQEGEIVLTLVYQLVDQLLLGIDRPCLGIGIGTPGLVEPQNGRVIYSSNLTWRDVALKDLVEERYQLPVHVANDSQVAALADLTFGNGKGASNLIAILVGRGLGAGIVLDGQVYHGDSFGAGEIGHVVVEDNGEPCTCGRNGCLRTVVGSKVAVKHARQIAERDPQSIYHHLVDSLEDITVDVVLEAYNAGDEATLALIKEAGFHLGKAVAHLVGALNIHRIIITGSMARFGWDFTNAIQKEVSQRVLPALANEIQIEPSSLGQDTVALGAAALLLANELALH